MYRQWKEMYNCSFHYLSAMPDQLYAVTKDFVDDEKFPDGTFHMRIHYLFQNYGFYGESFFRFRLY